ncbi:DNA-binding protein [soil metagenome]
MRSKLLHDNQGERTFVVIFDKGDEPMDGLARFAKEQKLSAARISGIGAFSDATLGFFDRGTMNYKEIPVKDQVEVLSLLGDIALSDDEPKVHVHVVLGKVDGSTVGGHLIRAEVWPTLEVMVVESPTHLRKYHDKETGLALIRP